MGQPTIGEVTDECVVGTCSWCIYTFICMSRFLLFFDIKFVKDAYLFAYVYMYSVACVCAKSLEQISADDALIHPIAMLHVTVPRAA